MFRKTWDKAKSYLPRADKVQAERAHRYTEGTERVPMAEETVVTPPSYEGQTTVAPAALTYEQVIAAADLASRSMGIPDSYTPNYYVSTGRQTGRTETTSAAALQDYYGTILPTPDSVSSAIAESSAAFLRDAERTMQQAAIFGTSGYVVSPPLTGTSTRTLRPTDYTAWYSGDRDYMLFTKPKRFKITVNTRRKWD